MYLLITLSSVDHSGRGDDDLVKALDEKFAARHVQHLYDILHSEVRPLEYYYGDDTSDFGDKRLLAEQLVPRFEDAVKQALDLRDNHFRNRRINRTAVVDYLTEEGVLPSAMEPMKAKDLLFAAYEVFYSSSLGNMPEREVDRLVARGTLFEDRKDRTYRYTERAFRFEDLKERVDQFRRTYGTRGKHFDVWVYEDEVLERAVLHLFRERPRQAAYRFNPRVNDDADEDDHRGPPKVTTDSIYRVKALKIRVRNEDDEAVLELSKSETGWTEDVEALMEDVFNVSNALSEEYQYRSDTIEEYVTGAVKVAQESLSEDEEDADTPVVDEWLKEEIKAVTEDGFERLADDDEIEETELERIRDIAETIEPTGIRYEEGETITRLDLKAGASLGDVMERRRGARALFTDLISEGDTDASIGIEFRAELPTGNIETFVWQDGIWLPDGGVSPELGHALDTLYDDRTHE